MKPIFNINRLGMLLKRFFLENRQRELTFWGVATLLFAWFPFSGIDRTSIALIIILISGSLFTSRMFKIFNYTSGGMHYLLIPATHLEKLITAILLSTVYFVAMIVITHVVGRTVGTTISNFIYGMQDPICFELIQSTSEYSFQKQTGMTLFNTVFLFTAFQSVFLLGSIYFKGNVFGKTTLVIIVAAILLFYFFNILLVEMIMKSSESHQSRIAAIDLITKLFSPDNIVFILFKYAFIPFFWLVSYFRLTEKQV
ncbi:MAG: hypothetical protein PHI48_04430 [Bacteroidales bacterium]|nr:hypothetical protein [Bacteroidales bacterium]